jgi:hypothetical protein
MKKIIVGPWDFIVWEHQTKNYLEVFISLGGADYSEILELTPKQISDAKVNESYFKDLAEKVREDNTPEINSKIVSKETWRLFASEK